MRKILVVVLVLLMAFTTAACGAGDKANSDASTSAASGSSSSAQVDGDLPVVAFITNALANDSQRFAYSQMEKFAPEYGFQTIVIDGQNDAQKEVAGVDQCIAQGVAAILSCPSDISAIVPALQKAKDAGIIVGMFSSDVAPESAAVRDFFCGVNDIEAGSTAAEAFKTKFPDGATIVEIGGQSGHDAQIKRTDGFKQGLEGSNIEVLESQNCPTGWLPEEAMKITEDFLTKYGDKVQGIFCHWDNGAAGVIQALQNAGLDDVYLVAVDGNSAGYQQVKDGTQAVCIGQSFTNMAKKSLENIRLKLDGEPYEEINFIPLDVVTPDTIDTFTWPEW